MKSIDLVFSSDDNYAQHLGVVLCSIFENKSNDCHINVHIIDGGISPGNKDKLRILETKYSFEIKYLYLKIENYKDLFISDHITHAAYYRILIPDLLDEKINKILYLDCDLIVLGDLIGLFETNIDNYFIGAIEENGVGLKQNLNMNEESPYFNSGVMLINLNKWREFNVSSKTLVFIRENPRKIKFWDQDALNVILEEKCLILDKRFNYLTSEIEKTLRGRTNRIIKPIIIHYSSHVKPWRFNGDNPFNDEYFYYLEKTPWNNKIYQNKFFRIILIKMKKMIPHSIKKYVRKKLKHK